ncbi:hypothetical protein WJX74_001139 [Apatococcus lobatus]|uniref:Transposase n=1 Tax=Apatococcus lobatus TaxID=904363 RepID=A0AAW1SDJ2_9CHLO
MRLILHEVEVSAKDVPRALQEIGWTKKKVTTRAREANTAVRESFILHRNLCYAPERLIYIGESACDGRNWQRRTGWAQQGSRTQTKQPFI